MQKAAPCAYATSVAAVAAWLAAVPACAPPESEDPDAAVAPGGPSPMAVEPRSGAEAVPVDKVIRITYSAHLDSRSLDRTLIDLHSGPVSRYLFAYYDPARMQLVLWPPVAMRKATNWSVEIGKGVLGLDGAYALTGEVTRFATGYEAAGEKPFRTPSFQKEVKPIFDGRCASCHGGPPESAVAGLALDTETAILETAVNGKATGWPGWSLIAPGRPGESYLLFKVIGYSGVSGMRMPRGPDMEAAAEILSQAEQELLSDWIVSGATFFDPGEPAELGSSL